MVINSGEDPTLALQVCILALLQYWGRRNLFYWTWARMIISLTLSGTYLVTIRRVDIRVELRFRITEKKNEKKLGLWRHDWEGGSINHETAVPWDWIVFEDQYALIGYPKWSCVLFHLNSSFIKQHTQKHKIHLCFEIFCTLELLCFPIHLSFKETLINEIWLNDFLLTIGPLGKKKK